MERTVEHLYLWTAEAYTLGGLVVGGRDIGLHVRKVLSLLLIGYKISLRRDLIINDLAADTATSTIGWVGPKL
jgi:hypothetical protein